MQHSPWNHSFCCLIHCLIKKNLFFYMEKTPPHKQTQNISHISASTHRPIMLLERVTDRTVVAVSDKGVMLYLKWMLQITLF